MFPIQKIPGRTVQIKQDELLWFGGTSYLGIPHSIDFQLLVKNGFELHGANWGSSRNNPIQIGVFDEAETFLAEFTNVQSALTVSSGMLAGQLVLHFLKNKFKKASIIYAPRVHPALWWSDYQPNSQSFTQFVNGINKQVENNINDEIIIVADSVSSPHFEYYNFDWVKNLPQNKSIYLVIDDSHSLGIMGENGGGVYKSILKRENVNLIVVASLNKALGVPAGVILADNSVLEGIRKTAFFSGCSPMSPAFAYSCANAKAIYDSELLKLKANIDYFSGKISVLSQIGNLTGHPAFCFHQKGLHEYLLKYNIFVPSFGYPSPTDLPITRLVISSLHTTNDLDFLSIKLKEFFRL